MFGLMGDFTRIFIRDWRLESGLTEDELAELMDVPRDQLDALEKNESPYTPQMVYRLARIFDIDAFRLFTHPAVHFEKDGLREAMTPEALSALLRIFLPDVVSSLRDKGKLDDLINDELPDEYWEVQSDKLLKLMEFLKSYRDDPSSTLRSLFEALETQPPSPDRSC
ncbi:hypothetical protein GCM10011342_01860 [Aquisalinus flavus]|uniref:HTH cro/C1-type domain-containing protein n=2 Tax=Aquisalinus flavus TaxID=1526572 RepID=A0A8J2Y5Z6_9PROT|nr:hypothetical protein GCM10011342_01860 [Aquisalinus flavus]